MAKRIKSIEDLSPDFKITHEFADGVKTDSVKGMVIPYTPETRIAYELIAKYS